MPPQGPALHRATPGHTGSRRSRFPGCQARIHTWRERTRLRGLLQTCPCLSSLSPPAPGTQCRAAALELREPTWLSGQRSRAPRQEETPVFLVGFEMHWARPDHTVNTVRGEARECRALHHACPPDQHPTYGHPGTHQADSAGWEQISLERGARDQASEGRWLRALRLWNRTPHGAHGEPRPSPRPAAPGRTGSQRTREGRGRESYAAARPALPRPMCWALPGRPGGRGGH